LEKKKGDRRSEKTEGGGFGGAKKTFTRTEEGRKSIIGKRGAVGWDQDGERDTVSPSLIVEKWEREGTGCTV